MHLGYGHKLHGRAKGGLWSLVAEGQEKKKPKSAAGSRRDHGVGTVYVNQTEVANKKRFPPRNGKIMFNLVGRKKEKEKKNSLIEECLWE